MQRVLDPRGDEVLLRKRWVLFSIIRPRSLCPRSSGGLDLAIPWHPPSETETSMRPDVDAIARMLICFLQKTSKHGQSATPPSSLILLFLPCIVREPPVLFDTYTGCCFLERCAFYLTGVEEMLFIPLVLLSIRVACSPAPLFSFFHQSFGRGGPAGGFSCNSVSPCPISTPSTDSPFLHTTRAAPFVQPSTAPDVCSRLFVFYPRLELESTGSWKGLRLDT